MPFTPATGDRLLVRADQDKKKIVERFADATRRLVKELELSGAHVLFPTDGEAQMWTDAGFMLRHGVQYHWHNASPKKFETFEDFLTTQPSKKRTQIRRERKQPAMDGVTLSTLAPEEYTQDVARQMHALYLTTVDKHYYGRRYMTRKFFELVAERFRHRLAWVVARKEGRIVASAFNVRNDETLYGRYWGSHVEMPFLHFNTCFYHGIDDAIRLGLQTFNPGAGGEHKRVRGFKPTMTSSAHYVEDPRFRQIIGQFLERERAAIEGHLRGEGDDEP